MPRGAPAVLHVVFAASAAVAAAAATTRPITVIHEPLLLAPPGEVSHTSAMAALQRLHRAEVVRLEAVAKAATKNAAARLAADSLALAEERAKCALALHQLETLRAEAEASHAEAQRCRTQAAKAVRKLSSAEAERKLADAKVLQVDARVRSLLEERDRGELRERDRLAAAEAELELERARPVQEGGLDEVGGEALRRALLGKLLLEAELRPLETELQSGFVRQAEQRAVVSKLEAAATDLREECESSEARVALLQQLLDTRQAAATAAAVETNRAVASLQSERDDACSRAEIADARIDALCSTLLLRDNALENASQRLAELDSFRRELDELSTRQALELEALRRVAARATDERNRAVDAREQADARYEGQVELVRSLQGRADHAKAELDEAVNRVTRQVEMKQMEVYTAESVIASLQTELETQTSLSQDFSQRVESMTAQFETVAQRELDTEQNFQVQLAQAGRLAFQARELERETRHRCEAQVAESRRAQKEALALLTLLRFDALHLEVLELVARNVEQADELRQLAQYRDAFFDVDVASAALADAVEPLQQARDVAFEMLMLASDEARALRQAAEQLGDVCESLSALEAHAAALQQPPQLLPQPPSQRQEDARVRAATPPCTPGALQPEAPTPLFALLGDEAADLRWQLEQRSGELEELAVEHAKSQADHREKQKRSLHQLIALKEKLDEAQYEVLQWAGGHITKLTVAEWREARLAHRRGEAVHLVEEQLSPGEHAKAGKAEKRTDDPRPSGPLSSAFISKACGAHLELAPFELTRLELTPTSWKRDASTIALAAVSAVAGMSSTKAKHFCSGLSANDHEGAIVRAKSLSRAPSSAISSVHAPP